MSQVIVALVRQLRTLRCGASSRPTAGIACLMAEGD